MTMTKAGSIGRMGLSIDCIMNDCEHKSMDLCLVD